MLVPALVRLPEITVAPFVVGLTVLGVHVMVSVVAAAGGVKP